MDGLSSVSPFLFIQDIKVEIHLAGELRLKFADLQLNGDEAFEETMIKEQINEVFLLPGHHSMLPADEAKPVAKFQDEILQLLNQLVFQLPFLNLPTDAEKFQVIGTLQRFLRLPRRGAPAEREGSCVLFLRPGCARGHPL